ncbi:hypothetical protein JCM8097_007584 [Rhodosporidiobolus ruineniae]
MTTKLNFAPYEQTPPDASRPALSSWATPSHVSSAAAADPSYGSSSYQSGAPVSSLSDGTSFGSHPSSSAASYGYAPPGAGGGGLASGFEMTLPLRHAWAGTLAYCFGPLGAAALLVFEVENDWVRFQAWQSVLLNAALVLLHLFFLALFGRGFFQTLLILVDIAALTLMSLRAFHDSDHLEKYKLPLLGDMADQFVRSE